MGSFDASLKTLGDRRGLPATLRLDEGRLEITVGEQSLGDWSLDEISLEPIPTGYRLGAEGDQILLEMKDVAAFRTELTEIQKGGRRLWPFGRSNGRKQKARPEKRGTETAPAPAGEQPSPPRATRREPVPAVVEEQSSPPQVTLSEPAPASTPDQKQAKRLWKRHKLKTDRTDDPLTAAPGATETPETTPRVAQPRPTSTAEATVIAEPAPPAAQPETAEDTAFSRAEPEIDSRSLKERAARHAEEADLGYIKRLRSKATSSEVHSELVRADTEVVSEDREGLLNRLGNTVDKGIFAAEKRWGSLLPDWVFTRAMFAGVFVALILILVFPSWGSTALVAIGLLLVAFGAVVYTDSMLATRWLPGRMTPRHVLGAGMAVVLIGILLGILTR